MKIKALLFALLISLCTYAQEEFDFAKLLPEKFDKANIISEKNYNVWGTNILKGKDGKYHAIYSRWPKSRGHLGWVTHSEIAHAVSDHLTGPYVYQNTVLKARGKAYWDGDCTHNPHVMEYEGKYYLYHMGNKGSGYWDKTPKRRKPNMKDDEWWVNRNNQRIGLAITEDLNGEWTRLDKPLIDVTGNRMMTSTPTISQRHDGMFLLAYKYVEPHPQFKNGKVVHVTATSHSPEGPFVDTEHAFITHPTASFAIDDHVEWVHQGKYYCLAKDSRGAWSDYPDGSTMLFEADHKGYDWKPAKHFLVLKAGELPWTDGSVTKTTRTADMPKFYMENGIPKALIVAVLPQGSDDSYALVVPLKTPTDQPRVSSYYVSPTGDDSNTGDLKNPFRTINKAACLMQAGDVCYIREGVYKEVISPINSGTPGKPITFCAYKDEKVWIEATDEIEKWEQYKGNIYKSTSVHKLTDLAFEDKALFYKDKVLEVARWPNNVDQNPYTFEGFSVDGGSASSVTSKTSGFPNIDLAGGAITYFGEHCGTTWTRKVTSSDAGVINYTKVDLTDWPFSNHNPTIEWRRNRGQIFVSNRLELLDTPGEWYFEEPTGKWGQLGTVYAYFPNGNAPQKGEVKLTARTHTATIERNYIVLDGLNFFGGEVYFKGNNCIIRNCNLQHCSQIRDNFKNCNANTTHAALVMLGNHNLAERNLIEYGSNNGILMSQGDYCVIDNNIIRYFNTLGIHAKPISSGGNCAKITRNTIYMTGRDGITTTGRNCEVAYNDVSHCMMITNDGGVYYTVGNEDIKNTAIHHNWFHDSKGPAYADGRAAGVYLDNYSKGYDVHHNVISNITWSGVQYNLDNTDLNIYNNTIWNAGASTGHWVLDFSIARINISNNIASAKSSDVSADNFAHKNIEADWIGTHVSKHNIILRKDYFEDVSRGVFIPKKDAPFIDAGEVIKNFNADFKGKAPDLGAHEFGGKRWRAGATWSDQN